MKSALPLFLFVDACGWEIIRDRPFGLSMAPFRKPLESVFGYSSACVPSILSGRMPREHRNWCYFVYDPDHSPFRWLRPLRWLPARFTSRRRVRRWLSKAVKARLRFQGYFDLYNIPFEFIDRFDFTEKKSPLKPGGMNRGSNIFDVLESRRIAYHAGDPALSENENLECLLREVRDERIDFAFAYLPELDGLLHRVGNVSDEIDVKLAFYERWFERIVREAREHYAAVRLHIFSDHGMANCDELLDLQSHIDALPLEMGRDFAVVYDSTMARFWFFNPVARCKIIECLQFIPQGRILSKAELAQLGCDFKDAYFGEMIFLVREGVLIVPSHMGARPIRAMHGYHPAEKHSYAALLSNVEIPTEIQAIPDLYRLMVRDAEWAREANASPGPGPIQRADIGGARVASQRGLDSRPAGKRGCKVHPGGGSRVQNASSREAGGRHGCGQVDERLLARRVLGDLADMPKRKAKPNPAKSGNTPPVARPPGSITHPPPTRGMVEQRARELAAIAGRDANHPTASDRRRAKGELLGQLHHPPERDEASLDTGPWDPTPASTGRRLKPRGPHDDRTVERLVEEGVEEAGHSQMIEAHKRRTRNTG